VSAEEENALAAFQQAGGALDTKALGNAGVSNVSRVMKQLSRKFPGAVRLPGDDKGTGYYICVRPAPPT
jgi:hypothetical protein